MALSILDFPQPEGPTMSRELPACRVMVRLRHSCRDLVGVNMLRDLSVRPACRRWVRTIREEDAFASVRAAYTSKFARQMSKLGYGDAVKQGELQIWNTDVDDL